MSARYAVFAKRRAYFEGFYIKQQNDSQSIAFIPAFHIDDMGRESASLQIITDTQAYYMHFPIQSLYLRKKDFYVRLDDCIFCVSGCKLRLKREGVDLAGELHFSKLTAPAYDIMGPFCCLPFMECRHSVQSLSHRVNGYICLNGKTTLFRDGRGYIEGDRGTSFPERYIWTQCNWGGNSIMLSLASIPYLGMKFNGCIGFIHIAGKEKRIATYLGAKLLYAEDACVLVRQGNLLLQAALLDARPQPLRAPSCGNMERTIHESISCTTRYICYAGHKKLFDFADSQASFEGCWNSARV